DDLVTGVQTCALPISGRSAGRGRLALVLSLEPLDAAGGVHELLLARVERVALGADFHPDVGLRRASLDDLAARARDLRVDVIRMNASLHGPPPSRSLRIPGRAQKRKNSPGFQGVSRHRRMPED